MTASLIGSSPPRVDGRKKVTATASYVAGMTRPGLLHVALARSRHPSARLTKVDLGQARAAPGVVMVLAGADLLAIPGLDPILGPAFKDHPLLAIDRVRFAGEAVAAVLAENPTAARDAAALIEIDYEELPAVFDAVAAARPGAPLVHERIQPAGFFPDLAHLPARSGTNVCYDYHLRRGDVERGFGQADRIFEHTFTSPPAQHASMETHAYLAEVEADGKVTVWTNTQTPSFVQSELAEVFGLPLNQVRVRVPYLGGGFGGKMYDKWEPLVGLFARLTGRPAKLVLSRSEEFYTLTKHGATVRLKSGVMNDGRIVARQVEIFWNTGAYADIGPRVAAKTGFASAGPYRIENVAVDSYCVYTNLPPAGAFRGFGVPQVVWAHERQADIIARTLGLDPVGYRLAQCFDEGDATATGALMEPNGLKECLRGVVSALDRPAQGPSEQPVSSGRRRGRGIACGLKAVIYPSTSTAHLKVNSDASATVYTSTVEMGQGSETVLAQVAAEVLGLRLEKIVVTQTDTDVTPYDTITAGSRSTYHMGNAVRIAAEDARRQILEAAARRLEANPADLELANEQVLVRGAEQRRVGLAELFATALGGKGGTVVGQGRFAPAPFPIDRETGQTEKSTEFWFPGASAVEVEVDTETGRVALLRIAAAADVGKAIHPRHVEQQIRGGTGMALSLAMFEEIVYEGGQVANPTLADYLLTSTIDLPELEAVVVEVPHPRGPFGARGVGETAIFSLAPAIANAVANAAGVELFDLPITPERVLRALRERSGVGAS